MNSSAHHQILIVGGGTAGITVAARLARKIPASGIAIIELYLVKKWLLPELYWHAMLRGLA